MARAIITNTGSLELGTDGAADTYIKLQTDTVGKFCAIGTNTVGADTIVGMSHNRGEHMAIVDPAQPSSSFWIEQPFGTLLEWNSVATKAGSSHEYRVLSWSFDTATNAGSIEAMASSSTWLADDQVTQIAAMRDAHLSIGPTASTTDALLITQVAETSGVPNAMHIVSASHTDITASTACADVFVDGSATKTWAAGSLATLQADFLVDARTYAANGSSVFTKAATLAVSAGPIAGANMTITTSLGIYCGGKAEFADLIDAATPNGIRVRNGTSYGATFQGVSSNVMGIGVYGGTTDFNISTGFLFRNINGFVGNLKMFGGYNQTQSYPVLEEIYTFAADAGRESWGGGHKVTTSSWNTGGTPAAENMVWFDQYTSVQGNPPTLFREIWLKRGAGVNTKMVNIPGQQVTISGAKAGNTALASVIAFLFALFPGIVNDTTT